MTISSRRLIEGLVAVVAAMAIGAPRAAAAGCAVGFQDAGGGVCTATLVYTGAPEGVTLPSAVSVVTAVVSGAAGGSSLEEQVDPFGGAPSPGGNGGRAIAVVPVAPGATLTVVVGQAGTGGVLAPPGFGGYGGGGHATSRYGGNGGGGSFVFDDAGVLIAAGGGGGGGYDYNPVVRGHGDQQAAGGSGSGAAPAGDGQSVAFCCDTTFPPPVHNPPGGGGGATPSGPGAGGKPNLPPGYAFGQADGDPGSGPATDANNFGTGGSTHNGCCQYTGWAGGGGGGYYGGGGGGNIEADLEGGGGGGGAGYVTPLAVSSSSQTGVQVGDGEVTLSYYTGACHPSCASCSGPAPTQCASCPSGMSLVDGACVPGGSTTTSTAVPTTTTTTSTLPPGVCGDGILDPGEQCDDGAALNGTPASCCDGGCRFQPAATACADDGSPCTADACDGAGVCVHPGQPATTCATPTTAGGASLVLVNDPLGADQVKFKWAKGPTVEAGDFGAPDTATLYALCIYDQANGSPARVYGGRPGTSCGKAPCWKRVPKPPKPVAGWKFRSKGGMPEGIVTVALKAGVAGKASVQMTAGKLDLGLPAFPLAASPAVIAQVRTSSGQCWGASFPAAGIKRNDAQKFIASSQ